MPSWGGLLGTNALLSFSLSENFPIVAKLSSKNIKPVAANPQFWCNYDKIEILSKHDLLCRQFATFCLYVYTP